VGVSAEGRIEMYGLWNNYYIGFIIPSGQEIVFCCSNVECIYRIRKMREGEEEKDES